MNMGQKRSDEKVEHGGRNETDGVPPWNKQGEPEKEEPVDPTTTRTNRNCDPAGVAGQQGKPRTTRKEEE